MGQLSGAKQSCNEDSLKILMENSVENLLLYNTMEIGMLFTPKVATQS